MYTLINVLCICAQLYKFSKRIGIVHILHATIQYFVKINNIYG